MDFIADCLAIGRMTRILTVVNAFTRESLGLKADNSLGSGRFPRVSDRRDDERGLPACLRLDAEPGFTSRRMQGSAEERKIALTHIQLGRLLQNGHLESFHRRLREESLNACWFRT